MFVLIGATWLTGCVGVPVQEMSDARQAVRAAQKAGAADLAPEMYSQARQHLSKAQTSLNLGQYRSARDEAQQAREKAIEARRTAEQMRPPLPHSP